MTDHASCNSVELNSFDLDEVTKLRSYESEGRECQECKQQYRVTTAIRALSENTSSDSTAKRESHG